MKREGSEHVFHEILVGSPWGSVWRGLGEHTALGDDSRNVTCGQGCPTCVLTRPILPKYSLLPLILSPWWQRALVSPFASPTFPWGPWGFRTLGNLHYEQNPWLPRAHKVPLSSQSCAVFLREWHDPGILLGTVEKAQCTGFGLCDLMARRFAHSCQRAAGVAPDTDAWVPGIRCLNSRPRLWGRLFLASCIHSV